MCVCACVRVCKCVKYVFVQVGQLPSFPSADITFHISLTCLTLKCIMLVIESTLLFDSLSPCGADKIFLLSFVFRGSVFIFLQHDVCVSHKSIMSSHLHLSFITRQCTVNILNYNTTLLQHVLLRLFVFE